MYGLVLIGANCNAWGGGGAPSIVYVVLQKQGTYLSQDINLETKSRYTLSFYARSRPDFDTSSLSVYVGNQSICNLTTLTTSWIQYTFHFTASSGGTNRIMFTNMVRYSGDPDVTVHLAVVFLYSGA